PGSFWLGKVIKLFRSELNYPSGCWCAARVVSYSSIQKKHLLTYLTPVRLNLRPGWLALHDKTRPSVLSPELAQAAITSYNKSYNKGHKNPAFQVQVKETPVMHSAPTGPITPTTSTTSMNSATGLGLGLGLGSEG
ncbi:unnamed protein product, partial [Discosporangium mesarthrocarpum]